MNEANPFGEMLTNKGLWIWTMPRYWIIIMLWSMFLKPNRTVQVEPWTGIVYKLRPRSVWMVQSSWTMTGGLTSLMFDSVFKTLVLMEHELLSLDYIVLVKGSKFLIVAVVAVTLWSLIFRTNATAIVVSMQLEMSPKSVYCGPQFRTMY